MTAVSAEHAAFYDFVARHPSFLLSSRAISSPRGAAPENTSRRLDRSAWATAGCFTMPTTIGGTIYAAMTLAAVAVETGIRTMSDDTYHHTVYPGLIHAADDVGWVLHASGGAGLGAMIIAASLAAVRARAVPSWAGWLGVAVGILSLGLLIFFPWFVAAIWILVVSVGMFIRGGRPAQPRPAA